MTRLIAGFLLIPVLVACTAPPVARPEASWLLDVLGPKQPLLFRQEGTDDWVTQGDISAERVRLEPQGGRQAVRVLPGKTSLVLARKLDAHLLATPFLTWEWRLSPHAEAHHPVSLVVGFKRGAPTRTHSPSGALPGYDRILHLVWGQSALNRGWAEPIENSLNRGRYIVRGGRELTARWYAEGVNLMDLHQQIWPTERLRDMRIVFAGIAAGPMTGSETAYVRGLDLRR